MFCSNFSYASELCHYSYDPESYQWIYMHANDSCSRDFVLHDLYISIFTTGIAIIIDTITLYYVFKRHRVIAFYALVIF